LRKLEELKQSGDLAVMQAEVSLLLGQISINLKEAEHQSLFVAGWRPFVGWCGGLAFAYSTILEPIARFVAVMVGYAGEFPSINNDLTMQVLLGMLGLGLMRTYEKKNSIDNKGSKPD